MPTYTKTAIVTAETPRVVGHFTIQTFLCSPTGTVMSREHEGREGVGWHAAFWQNPNNAEPQAFITPPIGSEGLSSEQEACATAQNEIETHINQNRDPASLIFLFD
jgi:hypothetical protein